MTEEKINCPNCGLITTEVTRTSQGGKLDHVQFTCPKCSLEVDRLDIDMSRKV